MVKVLSVYKPIGITPNQLIEKLRKIHSEYRDEKIGFAGRLDPLARGVLLLMIGEETKNRDKYLALSKVYEFQVLFGVETDTFDALGYLQSNKLSSTPDNLEEGIKEFINSKMGKQVQIYPPYSSKTVLGKPLYWWARNNKLSEIKIPEKEIEIFSFDLIKIEDRPTKLIKEKVLANIAMVEGDFRQEETINKWNNLFESNLAKFFKVASFRIHCSSGTYVRSLVQDLGKEVGSGAIALDILRTKVGDFTISDTLRV